MSYSCTKKLGGSAASAGHPNAGKGRRFGCAELQENGGEGKVARIGRKSVLYSKAVYVPCDVAVLLRAVSLTERQSDL